MKDYTVTYENLILSTYELEHIIQLEISKSFNQHAVLTLTGILDDEKADQYIYTTRELTPITLAYQNQDGEQETLFKGAVSNLNIQKQGDIYLLSLEAVSFTGLMDAARRSRSFQNVEMTVRQLVEEVMKNYEGSDFIMNIPDVPIGQLVMQYRETDWNFLKRFFTRYGSVLVPDIQTDYIAYYIGIPDRGESIPVTDFQYTVSKSVQEYRQVKQNGCNEANEIEYIVFQIRNERVFQIGTNLELAGKSLYVEQAVHSLWDGILKNGYRLRLKSGIRTIKSYNPLLVGASVTGTVAAVGRGRIQVDLEIDEPGKALYWFPYSTMSASPDGSGWYCMPEKGDRVRVYFPTKEEGDAYAVSAVSSNVTEDPNVKYLKTIHDKMIRFDDNGIVINADNGQAVIRLNRDGGLVVQGQNNVTLSAKENLTLVAQDSLAIGAEESLEFKAGSASVKLDKSGNVTLKGSHIYNN